MRHTKLTLHLQIINIKSMKETNPLIFQPQLFFQTNEDNEGREPEISLGEREEKIERKSGTFFSVCERVSIKPWCKYKKLLLQKVISAKKNSHTLYRLARVKCFSSQIMLTIKHTQFREFLLTLQLLTQEVINSQTCIIHFLLFILYFDSDLLIF